VAAEHLHDVEVTQAESPPEYLKPTVPCADAESQTYAAEPPLLHDECCGLPNPPRPLKSDLPMPNAVAGMPT
jgi:hypothetical protein